MALLGSIPARRLAAGVHSIPPVQVPQGSTLLRVGLTRTNWPAVATTVAYGFIEVSHDGGQTWDTVLRLGLNGLPDVDENGNPAPDPVIVSIELRQPAGAQTFCRGSVEMFSAERTAAQLEAF